ncbi:MULTISPECIES: hypothetical protein [Lactobacillus]|uniref:hypothetical protein n=1 Tax=Lactobacillus TaxID=1578 RepID=UPI000A7A2CB3
MARNSLKGCIAVERLRSTEISARICNVYYCFANLYRQQQEIKRAVLHYFGELLG